MAGVGGSSPLSSTSLISERIESEGCHAVARTPAKADLVLNLGPLRAGLAGHTDPARASGHTNRVAFSI